MFVWGREEELLCPQGRSLAEMPGLGPFLSF